MFQITVLDHFRGIMYTNFRREIVETVNLNYDKLFHKTGKLGKPVSATWFAEKCNLLEV